MSSVIVALWNVSCQGHGEHRSRGVLRANRQLSIRGKSPVSEPRTSHGTGGGCARMRQGEGSYAICGH
jgi:hypothetical protein